MIELTESNYKNPVLKFFGAFFCCFFNLQSEKNGAVKKRRSNQADNPDSLCQEAETCYRLRLPEDFYQFWKFCEELDPEKPSGEVLNFVSSNFHSQKQPEGGKLKVVRCILMKLQFQRMST